MNEIIASESKGQADEPTSVEQTTILIVDDEAIARASMEALLVPEGYHLLIAKDGIEALEIMEEEHVDMLLLDVMMPGINGFEVCRRIRSTPCWQEVPIVMITALDDRESRLDGINSGADDFLCKPFDGAELRARCRTITRLNRYRKIVEQSARLAFLEDFDPITELPNRNLLESRLSQALARARRTKEGIAIIVIDLDNFDRLQQGLGEEKITEVLLEVSRRLLRCVRGRDTVARIGGDRFVVLQESTTPMNDVANVAQRIHIALEKQFTIAQHDLVVTGSIGISLYPADGDNPHTLLNNAVNAMLNAKKTGKNHYQFFSKEFNVAALARLEMEAALRNALARDEFILHFQPQIDIKDNTIVGMEALVRWQHPDQGMVPPDEFITLAEETGLIEPIGEWVMRTACRQFRAWQIAGLPVKQIAVNVSSRQFYLYNFTETVAKILRETHLEPQYLELELTESILMPDNNTGINAPLRMLNELKDLGVNLSIDDFGTGYSSLSYLERFPVDALKVDRSFIKDLTATNNESTITTSIIQLAHNLGIHVVTEGVELMSQLQFLLDRDCDQVQGYLFSRPVSGETMTRILEEGGGKLMPTAPVDSAKKIRG